MLHVGGEVAFQPVGELSAEELRASDAHYDRVSTWDLAAAREGRGAFKYLKRLSG